MPTYQTKKTYKGGFYNSIERNGIEDRVYTAEDVRKPYDVVFSDGVKPIEDGTAGNNLKVTVVDGLKIAIAAGHAKLGGAWFENTEPYEIELDAAGGSTRYDCIVIRNDDSEGVRAAEIYIKTLSRVPTVADLVRSGSIYELCIAYVRVPALVSSITDAHITDTRMHGELCTTMTGVGAVVTRTYKNTVFSTSENQKVIAIGIPQYDKGKDNLAVYIEGRKFPANAYTINSNSQITLVLGLPAVGTRVEFEVTKNVNGAASADATGEYLNMLEDVASVKKQLENHYYCNGASDNIQLSKMAQNWLNGGTDYASMKVIVHGNFGVTIPYSGEGTSSSPYIWLALGGGSAKTRRIVFDFADCSEIRIEPNANSYNTIVFGLNVDIIGANIIAIGAKAQITMFSTAAKTHVNADSCRFWVTAQTGYIARGGTFKDCRASFTAESGNAICFNTLTGGLLRLFGGEYYALAKTGSWGAVIYVNAEQTGAVVNTYSINCPTVTRNGYTQGYAVNCLTNDSCCSFTDTITKLTIQATGQNIRGTIARSIAGTI